MTPSMYMDQLFQQGDETLKKVLTPIQLQQAQSVLGEAHRYIGRCIAQYYGEDDMLPEAVEAATFLRGFLLVFLEHAVNPGLLRKAMRNIS